VFFKIPGYLGTYVNGRAIGDFWVGMKGYGFLTGSDKRFIPGFEFLYPGVKLLYLHAISRV
jgi:hypothetical protein